MLKQFYELGTNLLQHLYQICTSLLQKCWKRIRLEYLERFKPDKLEYTEELIREVKQSRKEYKEGKFLTHEELLGKEEDETS